MPNGQPDPQTSQAGVDITKLIRWNKYIPYLPFANH